MLLFVFILRAAIISTALYFATHFGIAGILFAATLLTLLTPSPRR